MELTQSELDTLNDDGFIVLRDRFTAEEADRLRARLPRLFAQSHPANIIEQGSGAVRTAMAVHQRDTAFAALVRDPRLLGPAHQIRPGPLYAQQVKVNVKAAFSGEVWQWHYDFATHHGEDGVPRPLALNLHVFLDDVTDVNGPLYFIPGSHRHGEHPARLDVATTSYPLWVVDNTLVRDLAQSNGITAATGPRGTLLIFFDTLIHGSPVNMSPWDRAIFSLIANPVSNALRHDTRPDFKHHRNLTPLPDPTAGIARVGTAGPKSMEMT